MSKTCDNCSNPTVKCTTGWHWDDEMKRSTFFYGNCLCADCWEQVQDDVGQYRPAPGYSKPARFIVAQQKTVTVTNKQAITYAIASGNWLKASAIHKDALRGKRFHVYDLQCKKWYEPSDKLAQQPQLPRPPQPPPQPQPQPQPSQPQLSQPQPPQPQHSPPPQPPSSQICPGCSKVYATKKCGTIRAHSYLGRRCVG